jgi:hypothetical protein
MHMHPNELATPPAVDTDSQAFEILRVWAAGGEQHVTIHSGLEGTSEDFGYLLAQLARHGAILYASREGIDEDRALARIREGFDDEWQQPTAWPTGEVPE